MPMLHLGLLAEGKQNRAVVFELGQHDALLLILLGKLREAERCDEEEEKHALEMRKGKRNEELRKGGGAEEEERFVFVFASISVS